MSDASAFLNSHGQTSHWRESGREAREAERRSGREDNILRGAYELFS
jgi:hypothetical protein